MANLRYRLAAIERKAGFVVWSRLCPQDVHPADWDAIGKLLSQVNHRHVAAIRPESFLDCPDAVLLAAVAVWSGSSMQKVEADWEGGTLKDTLNQ
jgi:hypothetical protein